MNKDFIAGAEMALRGAGIKDANARTAYMNKLNDVKISKYMTDIQNQLEFKRQMETLMPNLFNPVGPPETINRAPAPQSPRTEGEGLMARGMQPPSTVPLGATNTGGDINRDVLQKIMMLGMRYDPEKD